MMRTQPENLKLQKELSRAFLDCVPSEIKFYNTQQTGHSGEDTSVEIKERKAEKSQTETHRERESS